MPIFGSKSSFAIEADAVDADQRPFHPRTVFGRICFWTAEQQLGDYEQRVVLGAPASILGAALVHQGQRKDDTVNGKDKQEVLALIHNALYELETDGEEKTYAECVHLGEQFGKFDICTNSSEALDGIFAVLVDVDNGSRFIWRSYENENVQETNLASGEYEAAVQAFLDWYHAIEYDRRIV